MKLKDIADTSCTNFKVYIGKDLVCVYSPFKGAPEPLLDKEVIWLDAEDDIIIVGIEGGEKHEKE